MILDKDTFYKEVNSFKPLPQKIERLDVNEFKKVYGSEDADKQKNIVYMLLAENPIPRLLGESRIIYIGQTKTTFKKDILGLPVYTLHPGQISLNLVKLLKIMGILKS